MLKYYSDPGIATNLDIYQNQNVISNNLPILIFLNIPYLNEFVSTLIRKSQIEDDFNEIGEIFDVIKGFKLNYKLFIIRVKKPLFIKIPSCRVVRFKYQIHKRKILAYRVKSKFLRSVLISVFQSKYIKKYKIDLINILNESESDFINDKTILSAMYHLPSDSKLY